MSKLTENKKKKRNAILSAARKHFLTEGYIATSMDLIATEAGVTKQTVYRYFPSKDELFRDMLHEIRANAPEPFFDHLEHPDTEQALKGFAIGFIRRHLTQDHLNIVRLLIAEGEKAPEMVSSFFSVGPHRTQSILARFFSERFELEDPTTAIRLWIAMLLFPRQGALQGLDMPTAEEIEHHAHAACELLLHGLTLKQKDR